MADFIIIIRPQPDASRDVAWLARYHVPALAAPVMEPAPKAHTLPDSSRFQAILFTSRYAVAGLAESAAITGWRSLPVYAVGRGTALAAKQAGFTHIVTGHGGGAGLVPLINRDLRPDAGGLFWPSAEVISYDMAAHLAPDGFTVQRMPVYAMPPSAGLDDAVAQRLATARSAAVVAMSARSLSLFSDMLGGAGLDAARKHISVIAASAAIAAAAPPGWAKIFTAKAPRRSRLLAIATFLHRRRDLAASDR